MKPDDEGFLFPNIDGDACIHCGACERICPVNPEHPKDLLHGEPLAVYAAWNRDEEIRRQSSSGGVFTALAEQVLEEGGAVVGAAFDEEFRVRHVMVETKEDLARLRGSKYVQSEISLELYTKVRSELRKGRKVLFSGTPCQVAGMREFLRKKHDNFLCCDIVCHGVPSPRLWKVHFDEEVKKYGMIEHVSFRDKSNGWKKSGPAMMYRHKGGGNRSILTLEDSYSSAFIKDACLRYACYQCAFTKTKRVGDVTLADFWGVERVYPEYGDDKGVSLVTANNEGGRRLLENAQSRLLLSSTDIENAIPGNPMLRRSSHYHPERQNFYKDLQKGYFFLKLKYGLGCRGFLRRMISKILRILDFWRPKSSL